MGIKRLLIDYHIPFVTEGNSHCTEGWVNIHCPLCSGSRDYHLGINLNGAGAHCWRCGGHSVPYVVGRLLNIPTAQAASLVRRYSGTATRRTIVEPKVSIFPLKLPTPHTRLNGHYKDYLAGRGYDPDQIEREWGVLQTGPVSFLDGINYSHRILIPIEWGEGIVSFQTRDITGRSQIKYLSCPKRREKVPHKDILYCNPKYLQDQKTVIVVEGVFDVWRFGPGAVATFGISIKMKQVMALARNFDRFFIVFDGEPQAQASAQRLSTKLKALGKEAYVERIEGDPGEMDQDDADHFVKNLLGGIR